MEAKKAYKTYAFRNSIAMTGTRRGTMTLPEHAPVEIGSPPAFHGEASVWCPEELLLGAVNSCLMLTFLGFAGRRGVRVVGVESQAEGTVENVDGKYQVARIHVQPVITLGQESDAGLAAQVMSDAREACFLSNSVRASVEVSARFVSGGAGVASSGRF